MSVSHVAFVMYPVSDMARSIEFYTNVLGFRKAGLESDSWVEFEVGGTTFGLGNFPQVGKPGTAQSLAIEVTDMAAFRADLAAKGYDAPGPHETPVCFISGIQDPDGNSITIHQLKSAH